MLDLTGGDGGQDAPDEAPDLSDFEQDDDQKEEKSDEFDQQDPTQEIDNLYASNDGAFTKSHIVQQRYIKLLNLSPDAISMFRDQGKYHDLEERLRNIVAWEKLVEGGGRYNRQQDKVFTNENLSFL